MLLENKTKEEIIEYSNLYSRFCILDMVKLDNEFKAATNERVDFIIVLNALIFQSEFYGDDDSKKKLVRTKNIFDLFTSLK